MRGLSTLSQGMKRLVKACLQSAEKLAQLILHSKRYADAQKRAPAGSSQNTIWQGFTLKAVTWSPLWANWRERFRLLLIIARAVTSRRSSSRPAMVSGRLETEEVPRILSLTWQSGPQ